MNISNFIKERETPSLFCRIYSSWYRHGRVYSKNLFSNSFPPILEPIILMIGIGLGLGAYISSMDHLPYVEFLAISLPLVSAMFTSAFECSFGTFIRLTYNKVYDYMLSGPLLISDIFIGEICWAATKGILFSGIVECIFIIFGILPLTLTLLYIPLLGGLTGAILGALSLVFISYIKNINQINYYITGFISPLFMFSGTVFPVTNLPTWLQYIIEIFPLVHTVNLARGILTGLTFASLVWNLLYCFIFIIIFSFIAVKRMQKVIMK